MPTIENTYTHKGWFGIAPVYISEPESDAPGIEARWPALEWLVDLSEVVFGLVFSAMEIVAPDHEPMYPIRITGRLKEPVTRVAEVSE